MEQASCRACVDACPTGAWVMDDERLGIDSARCDGCGLCAPACPESAISGHLEPLRLLVDGVGTAFAACDRSGVGRGEGVLPCVHALGIRALGDLHRRGVRRLVLSRGDCPGCPRGGAVPLATHLARLNTLLADRDLGVLEREELTARGWERARRAARDRQGSAPLGRRAFVRGIFRSTVETAVEWADRPESGGEPPPLGRSLPSDKGSGVALFAPRIDPERCTGCDACARLCPHGAIQVEAWAYRLEPDDCTGCGLCNDLCTAIAVHQLDPAPQRRLSLHRRRCAGCGVDFHTPKPASGPRDLCPVCAGTRHHEGLFQVLA